MSCKASVLGVLAAGLLFLPLSGIPEETNAAPAEAKAPAGENPEAQQLLRAYLQVQEQLHSALLAIEQNRQEADAAARRNADMLAERLKLIEQALTVQRERDATAQQSSNRTILLVGGSLGTLGLLSLLLTCWFQFRSMNRLADLAATFPTGHLLGHQPVAGALGMGTAGPGEVVASGTRLLGVIERLEKKVETLEHAAHAGSPGNGTASGNGDSPAVTVETPAPDPAALELAERVSLLLGKGQTLLNLDQAEPALACFDEALALQPNHAEALVKKGSALERLKKLDEAIDCYDRAIAADGAMTLAYLCKGGVFNQMERFSEALECYEQALRTQHKPATS